MSQPKIGVLLANLRTPAEPTPASVRQFLSTLKMQATIYLILTLIQSEQPKIEDNQCHQQI